MSTEPSAFVSANGAGGGGAGGGGGGAGGGAGALEEGAAGAGNAPGSVGAGGAGTGAGGAAAAGGCAAMDAAQPALCAQAAQCVFRQLAQTSKVNAPQVAQGATDTPAAEDDMAAEMLGRQRDSLREEENHFLLIDFGVEN